MSDQEYGPMTELQTLRAEVESLRAKVNSSKKNRKTSTPVQGRKYVLLSKELAKWGKVPHQQQAIAEAISKAHEVGTPVSEADLQKTVLEAGKSDPRLSTSKQDAWYIFKYYRGLRNNGVHAGFVAREFLQQEG